MKKQNYLVKDEQGFKPKKEGKQHKVVVIYPNTYYIGMSSIGFQHIYFLINNHPDFYADRAFLSDSEIRTKETNKPLRNFEILFFSISFELDYLNMVRILSKAEIPIKSIERGLNYPLIIVGGACTFFNPEPIAEFTDIFVLGEGEIVLKNILDIYSQNTYENKNKFLHALENILSVYIPAFSNYSSSNIFHMPDISQFPAYSHIITPNTEFKNMLLCEISRGCIMKCKFCMVRSVYGQIRHQDKNIILDIAKEYKTYIDRIGLVAPAVTSYPHLTEMCQDLLNLGFKISFSSLRLDHLTPSIIEILVKSGQKTITLAPEAGSEKLRQKIGKNILKESIINKVETAVKCGILNIKLYFMIGLPEETWDDIECIVDMINEIKKVFVKISISRGKIGKIFISINPFIPKPFTEFQYFPMENFESLKKKYKFLDKTIRTLSNTELDLENLQQSIWQSVLSSGNRKMGDVLIKVKDGYNWRKALEDNENSQKFI
ncbi:radical SAM protein [Candidatus Poribacteria bacterium]|nr:radical SAM protein [Candidatus Poribacteria bacterium]